jgi:ATP-binding cassette subfamily B protein
MWGQARAVEKSLNFFPSLKRLLGHLAPERMILILVVLLAVIGIAMNVFGPKDLGHGNGRDLHRIHREEPA